ncbi:MAG: 30S ribosomal protein S2, partial [Proteobacteria bacterium]|nr:30S ribosomal protein S2 [Pseudomonadota bacterium]
IKDMSQQPSVAFIVDPKREHIAVAECRKLGIPIVAVVDTNCDPDVVDYIIPGNDDAIRAIKLFAQHIADACLDGMAHRQERDAAKAEMEMEAQKKEAPKKAAPKKEAAPAPAPKKEAAPAPAPKVEEKAAEAPAEEKTED